MEKVILELVSIDRQAQEAVRAAEERTVAEKARIVQEKNDLEAHCREAAEKEAQRYGQKIKAAREQELERLEAEYRKSLRELEEAFQNREEQWSSEIVQRCLRL